MKRFFQREAPDLALEDLTDNRTMHLVIKAHCINLESG